MCMYVAHWNIFMVNKCDLQKKRKKEEPTIYLISGTTNAHNNWKELGMGGIW